ncbi:hypothetical protein IC620_11710 [Hazenella sp. IB182357]|uniref:Transposase n=1 Tax=Polycladospora coralii TaxID=2771432 RepID=A0A926RXZ8_9BACL|nr:hypothetical protein [Polycladospora coralii]MBD1373021.1 hypothetical protein [Polycladospora coralii]
MQEHFHFNRPLKQVQRLFNRILKEVTDSYKIVVPIQLRQRRNLHLQKQEDAVLIAISILGKMLGFNSERMWHKFMSTNLIIEQFPERSHYHRRCKQLLQIIKLIRMRMLRHLGI